MATHPNQMAVSRQIETLAAFRAVIATETGIVVISEGSSVVVHVGDCRYVSEPHFVAKVIDSRGRGGRYWWFAQAGGVREVFARPRVCAHCITAARAHDLGL